MTRYSGKLTCSWAAATIEATYIAATAQSEMPADASAGLPGGPLVRRIGEEPRLAWGLGDEGSLPEQGPLPRVFVDSSDEPAASRLIVRERRGLTTALDH